MKLSQLASSMPFAHLLGRDRPIAVTANIRADENADEDDDAMKGRKSKARGRAEDDTDTDGDGNETDKKGARAEESEEEEDRDEEDERPDGKKGKAKSKSRADNSEEEEEEDGDKKARAIARAAVKQERARCKAIFGCEAAGVRPDMAAHLAFNTSMSAEDAVGMLNAFALGAPKGGRAGLSERMAGVKTPNPGPADVPRPDTSTAKGMAATMVGIYNAAIGRQGGNQ